MGHWLVGRLDFSYAIDGIQWISGNPMGIHFVNPSPL